MIVSSARKIKDDQFEKLLTNTKLILEEKNQSTPNYFPQRKPLEFEIDVHAAMVEAAKGTVFEGALELISGHKFPDIVDNNYYGVEVKTARNNWKSLGNSVLESTRVDGIERIYIFFGCLSNSSAFQFRKYEKCLSEVAVTHSPRYLIDMELEEGKSIFDKMNVIYDELRKTENPIMPFIEYYQSKVVEGEELWWMNSEKEYSVSPIIRSSRLISREEKNRYIAECFILFPEVFSSSSLKFEKTAIYLVRIHNLVCSNLRDWFSSNGRVSIELGGKVIDAPRIYDTLKMSASVICECIDDLDDDLLINYWNVGEPPENRLEAWKAKINEISAGTEDGRILIENDLTLSDIFDSSA